jgi:hypothetical protein
MKQWLLKWLKKAVENIVFSTLATIFLLSVGGVVGLRHFSKKAYNLLIQILNTPPPLWATISLVLLCCLYIYLKNKTSIPLSTPDPEYREYFHVYWDKKNKMRCLNCGKPLKCSSSDTDPSIFFCSNPMCNSKHILKDKHGNKLTEQEAIDFMDTM